MKVGVQENCGAGRSLPRGVVLAVDPGTFSSAWVEYDTVTGHLLGAGLSQNDELLRILRRTRDTQPRYPAGLIIEMLKSYGNALGDTVLETCVAVGRFIEAWQGPVVRLPRKTIVTALCNNPRANDTNVRAELMNRFGRTREKAIGTKASPGPLYRVTGDMWSALAVAVVYTDMVKLEQAGVPTYLTTAKEVWHEIEKED